MRLGGNARFGALLERYGLRRAELQKKYRSAAARYYRESLDALEKGASPAEAPSREAGVRVEGPASKPVAVEGFGSDDLLAPGKKPKKRSRSRFKEGWEKSKRKVESWGKGLSKKFGKIFRRSKSKGRRGTGGSAREDVSASNDSTFEFDAAPGRRARRNRFDDDLISFQKAPREAHGKPFLGWKNYLQAPANSKLDASFRRKIRTFKSQTSGGVSKGAPSGLPPKDPGPLSDREHRFADPGRASPQRRPRGAREAPLVPDPFQKKPPARDASSIHSEGLNATN